MRSKIAAGKCRVTARFSRKRGQSLSKWDFACDSAEMSTKAASGPDRSPGRRRGLFSVTLGTVRARVRLDLHVAGTPGRGGCAVSQGTFSAQVALLDRTPELMVCTTVAKQADALKNPPRTVAMCSMPCTRMASSRRLHDCAI